MKGLTQFIRAPWLRCLLISLFCTLIALALWQLGWLQFLEFKLYDHAIRNQTPSPTLDPLVIVELTDADIPCPLLDYPIHDDKLAELLRKLLSGSPAVIGLDIWRDIPVPKNGTGIHQFHQVLLDNPNIIAIFTLDGIQAPVVLRTNIEQIGFNDNLPADVDVDHTVPKVRRTLLIASSPSGESYDSFPFRLVVRYLEGRGIAPQPDPLDSRSFYLGKAHLVPFKPNDGAYIRADSGGWQMLIDYKCPDTFLRYTVSEVLDGKVPLEKLKDKVVVIGVNTPSAADERITPIRRNHRGVELQAVIIHQLLRQALQGDKFLRTWSESQEGLWLLVWSLIGGMGAYVLKNPARITVLLILGITTLLLSFQWAFRSGFWIPAILPIAGFVPASVGVIAFLSSQERAMRAVLMKLYSRQVSREIAESMWENRESFLEGQRPLAQKLTVTVLFTDLKGFSSISEKMEPARLYEWLNVYLGMLARVIQAHGGVLKQFTGDGALALFGVPIPHNTREAQAADATAAVRCALRMGEQLVELIQQWEKNALPPVSMRVGIYTGEVAAGSIGSDDRFEYAVIGDVVNTASRLESYDKSLANPDLLPNRCRILIGAPTFELLNDAFESREIGLLEVKGKAIPVPVHQILSERKRD